MTFIHGLELAVICFIVGAGGGWWAKGKYAAKAAAEIAKVATKI